MTNNAINCSPFARKEKEGKGRLCVIKLCKEMDQHFSLILLLNSTEISKKSTLGSSRTCHLNKDPCIKMKQTAL
jgi:hypothetical protein